MLSMLAILGAVATVHGHPAVGAALLTPTPPHLGRVGGGGSSHDRQRLRRQVATTPAADAGDDLDDFPLLGAIFIGVFSAALFSCGVSVLIDSAAGAMERAALKTSDDDAVVGSAVATVTGLYEKAAAWVNCVARDNGRWENNLITRRCVREFAGERGTVYTASYSFMSADGSRVTVTEDLHFAGSGRTAGQWHQWKQMRDSHTAVETPVR